MDGLRLVELGAGIGRFTGPLAAKAKSVVALDFMENLIDQNRTSNAHYGNIDFRCGDAMELALPADSCDVAFSNWLLMYLGDAEVQQLALNMLGWVVVGGHVFFRESCFRQSGDKARKNNPTHYRNPREYFRIFDGVQQKLPDGRIAHFELVLCKSVDTYVRVKQNQNQVVWKWKKVIEEEATAAASRHFLDTQQYHSTSIQRYERVFGPGFVSPGGLETHKEFSRLLNLQPDEQVLDVGCGLCGGAHYMARTFGCYVYGIDLSVNMILTALERAAAAGNGDKVSFEVSDALKLHSRFPEASFDVLVSRDTLLHISDKPALFKQLYSVLRPGGRLLITDYCKAEAKPSEGFAAYIQQRGYDLHTLEAYADMLRDAGFDGVAALDRTEQFKSVLERELAAAEADREGFVQQMSQEDYEEVVSSWRGKLDRAVAGEQKWGLFRAFKPQDGRDFHGAETEGLSGLA
ncbi:phosphoethanolamine N-methyltransferase 1-like [Micractinium conductrix]|uniref:phosphoethanolamine N-methyltransferase n=1 Tax=Micractinium conductrix TaxID=554055 RepID=A0A2P6VJT3_9CHLO|nr:phosphoethanolamine N-methyltransferase 1-like [Micractinium conductrix]|eukprot:PSC74355.1 phosphoethanolamine N-methyltransferase 1-like [Micractinium conductrix]